MNRIIDWFARNSVAANLLALVVMVAGLMTSLTLRKEIFPEFDSDLITVSVVYPGAAPEECEEGICVKIEEAIQGLEGIKKITATAAEGAGAVTIELLPGTDQRKALDDIKARVDAIDTFPLDAEKPVIREVTMRKQVINVAISGPADELALKRLGERVRDELAALPGITEVVLANSRPYEISIEVSEAALRAHGLTFDEVAQAVRRSSLDVPGGTLRTRGGEILLRTKGQGYRGRDFEELVLRTRPDGTRLRLGEVARVVDGFAETDQTARFDGQPMVLVQVFRVGEEDAVAIADAVKAYVARAQGDMPQGVQLTVWQDDSRYLRSRLELLLRNARASLILVVVTLALFIRLRLALWITFGIIFSFLGALWVMPALDVTINLLSLFAFVLVLGIVVDDAIVVGENIYTHQARSREGLESAIRGAQEVMVPVFFGVLTTVAAFVPLTTVPGNTGKVMQVIPMIVIPVLLFSLAESYLMLPTHLRRIHAKDFEEVHGLRGIWRGIQNGVDAGLQWWIGRVYQPSLEWCLRWRYLTLVSALMLLVVTGALVAGGRIKFVFFPSVEGENVAAFLTMPLGTSAEVTAETVRRIEAAVFELREQLIRERGEEARTLFRHVMASVGEQPYLTAMRRGGGRIAAQITGAHLGEVQIELAPAEERTISAVEIANRWRELTGPVPDAVELTFTGTLFTPGDPINVQFTGPDMEELRQVAERFKERLAGFTGVKDIADTYRAGKQEIKLRIKPEAEAVGLTLSDLGRQVRQAFYGEEAQRIQRGRDEVKVMVRYPESARRSLGDLEELRIRAGGGVEVPFAQVAEARMGQGYATITRVNRQRAISVTADVDASQANANEINRELRDRVLPELLAEHPSVRFSFEGERREQGETLGGVMRGLLVALLMIYALLAIPLASYLQPFIIMSAIPFGFVGAVYGHVLMGLDLTILSMFGLVALAGVAVNDSLVMVDFINRYREQGHSVNEGVRQAGVARFRAILLTSLTTFAGLFPLIMEKSLQAKFLIPMAVSLAFGVIFSTFVSLILVPVLTVILHDLRRWVLPGSTPSLDEAPPTGPPAAA
ncbi:efflux RND transporter permease subunit [Fontisphaera persica]|uniref:efflux RND transporter permease subunit n=1 Tax=Fontisphaera persica TaxID=2974023 RepID=UPI0024C0535A|nr:efflux RND transporter permease subunit [Fontisphaera persica]WCJ60209.1 efflux RND transporter permease subunit [Fontisphaera persica]